jgi:ABC-type uncharacterized transport system auxiliary subunit
MTGRLAAAAAALAAALAILAAAGCGLRSEPPELVRQWVLEYPPPEPGGPKLAAALVVDRLGAAEEYNSTDMVYRPAPRERGSYNYHRWRVAPGDMVGDLLLRDLRMENRLAGVFSFRQGREARFRLEGGVERMLEVDEKGGWRAELWVTLALIDTREKRVDRRVALSKDYRLSRPMPSRDAPGLAAAMSAAMQELSARARADIHAAVARALEGD